MVARCRSRAGLSPSSLLPAQPGYSARFASMMAEACSCVTLVSQASWKQLEADLHISSQLLGERGAHLVACQSADRFKTHGN